MESLPIELQRHIFSIEFSGANWWQTNVRRLVPLTILNKYWQFHIWKVISWFTLSVGNSDLSKYDTYFQYHISYCLPLQPRWTIQQVSKLKAPNMTIIVDIDDSSKHSEADSIKLLPADIANLTINGCDEIPLSQIEYVLNVQRQLIKLKLHRFGTGDFPISFPSMPRLRNLQFQRSFTNKEGRHNTSTSISSYIEAWADKFPCLTKLYFFVPNGVDYGPLQLYSTYFS